MFGTVFAQLWLYENFTSKGDFEINSDNKILAIGLAQCESETDIMHLLIKGGYWDKTNDWQYFGDNENNFGTIGTQQSKPDSALVEKITNAIDAVLMAQCLQKGVNPEGNNAPASTRQALVDFFGIYDGRLSNLSARERTKLADNILFVASGKKRRPCYTIIDKGEGQSPGSMPSTLLSLSRSNKLRIPFVQGKFNMGGTGVLQFCGEHNLQLIISRRHPEIAAQEDDESGDLWSVTVVRRVNPTGNMRNSCYMYLVPGGRLLTFEAESLPLLPSQYPDPYGADMEWGTFIKLYDYKISNGLQTNIKFDLFYRLSLLLPEMALPVKLYERRKGFSGKTMHRTLSGLSVRLADRGRDNLEEGFPSSAPLTVRGKKIDVTIYAFKRKRETSYKKNEGIILTVNGQTHGTIPASFFKSDAVGLGYIAGSLLVELDCTGFDARTIEDLFMNSRDRLRDMPLRRAIKSALGELLKNHPGLRELMEQRRRDDIEDKLSDSKPLAAVVEDILRKSPTLSRLFIDGVRLPNPFKLRSVKKAVQFEGRRFPNYFKMNKEYTSTEPKEAAINRRFRLQYQTDAVNNYFTRDSEPGSFTLTVDGHPLENFALNLWNGVATLNLEIPRGTTTGSILHFTSIVEDSSKVDPFTDEFYVRIMEAAVNKTGSTNGVRKPPSSNKKGKDLEKECQLALPEVWEIRRDEWYKYDFNAESALLVVRVKEAYDFYVNIDNIHLLTELKFRPRIDPKLLEAQYKFGLTLLGLALLKENNKKNGDNNDHEEDVYDLIVKVTKRISPVLLPMISSLSELDIEGMFSTSPQNRKKEISQPNPLEVAQ